MQHSGPIFISGDMSSPKLSTKGKGGTLYENEAGVGKKGWIQ